MPKSRAEQIESARTTLAAVAHLTVDTDNHDLQDQCCILADVIGQVYPELRETGTEIATETTTDEGAES